MTINRDYFSGAQASIFIGDIWVDDITNISFNNTYSAQPIYGYGSTWYDHVAEGRELIQGSFTVNFREPNYIWMILSAYKGKNYVPKEIVQADRSQLYDPSNQGALMGQKRQDLDDFFNANQASKAAVRLRNQKNLGNAIKNRPVSDFAYPTMDIVIGYGHELTNDSPGERLVDCKIVGKARTIMSDGNPIQETYNFFGRKQE